MSEILKYIKADFLIARKEKNHPKIGFLSTLIGEIENSASMVNGEKIILEESIISILKSFEKKANEILAIDPSKIEPEYLAKAKAEKEWINHYLPSQLTEDDIRKIFSDLDNSNLGLMMKHLKEKYAGLYDGKLASMVAKEFI